jgi:prepilin-type N-terminal cleavage/methylation domain-containing protein
MKRDAGFTLLEVMISMLIGTIGLMGTIAVQQAIISASKNANDAAIAMRLASQKIEELSAMNTDSQTASNNVGLGKYVALSWSAIEYVDAEGIYLRDPNTNVAIAPQPSDLGRYRWYRQWKVTDTGSGLPYVISVIVTYNNDVGDPKTTRLDMERRKGAW